MFYPPEATGIAPYAGVLAAELSKVGYPVNAFVAQPSYPEWRIRAGYRRWRRVEIIDGVRVSRSLLYVPQVPRGVRRLLSELSLGLRLAFSRWKRPEVLIAITPALFATALVVLRTKLSPRKRPLIVWVQDIYTLGLAEIGEGNDLVRRITRWVESWVLQAADRVVVIHQRFADFVIKELGVAPSDVVVVRNWTHLAPSAPIDATAARSELGWPEAARVALHTGNMGAKQGLDNIIEAARLAQIRDEPVRFILVGDGNERAALQQRAAGVSHVTFVSPLDDQKYRLALAAADVLIVNEKPGVSAMAVPSKLTSYFDAGRPVVAATDPGGTAAAEVMAAEAGVVVQSGDPNALLGAVLDVCKDEQAAATYGRNGRRYREVTLGQDIAVRRWDELIKEVVPITTG